MVSVLMVYEYTNIDNMYQFYEIDKYSVSNSDLVYVYHYDKDKIIIQNMV